MSKRPLEVLRNENLRVALIFSLPCSHRYSHLPSFVSVSSLLFSLSQSIVLCPFSHVPFTNLQEMELSLPSKRRKLKISLNGSSSPQQSHGRLQIRFNSSFHSPFVSASSVLFHSSLSLLNFLTSLIFDSPHFLPSP